MFRKMKSRGNNFCQVDRIRHIGQERPDIAGGNHPWAGAAPALVSRPRSINQVGARGGELGVVVHRAPKSKREEPNNWARKYLMADSCSLFVFI